MKEIIENIKELNEAIDAYWNGDKSEKAKKRISRTQRKSAKILDAYSDFKNSLTDEL